MNLYRRPTKDENIWIDLAVSKHSDELYVVTMDSGIVYTLKGQRCTWKQNPRKYRWELLHRGEQIMYFASVKNAKKWCCYRNAEQNPKFALDLVN